MPWLLNLKLEVEPVQTVYLFISLQMPDNRLRLVKASYRHSSHIFLKAKSSIIDVESHITLGVYAQRLAKLIRYAYSFLQIMVFRASYLTVENFCLWPTFMDYS